MKKIMIKIMLQMVFLDIIAGEGPNLSSSNPDWLFSN